MKCQKCNKELLFDESILKEFIACPYCGTFLPKNLPPIEAGTIEAELKKFADDFGGLEIFSVENSSRFAKSLVKLETPFDVARDKLLVANIKNIPQKLYSVLDQPQNEQQQMADLCLDEMTSFGLPQEFAKETVSWLAHVMQLPVNVEREPLIEKIIRNAKVKINYKLGSDSREFEDKRDYTYKICTIGQQEWFAENFNNDHGRNQLYDDYNNTIGQPCINANFGRLYNWQEAVKNAPEGWRLPTLEDFRDLVGHINSLGLNSGSALKSTNHWHGSADSGRDLFGFCANPTRLEKGTSQAWFWTSSPSEDSEYPYYCVSLSADSNELCLSSTAGTGYYACVRYVKDVEEK